MSYRYIEQGYSQGQRLARCKRCGARSSPCRPSCTRFLAQWGTSVLGYLFFPGPPPPRSSPGAGPSGGGDVQRWWGSSLFEEKLYPNTGLIAKITMMSEVKRLKRWRRLQTYFGLLSPAKPALVLLKPLSKTSLWTSSHILSRIDYDCWGQTLQEDINYAQRQFITFLRHDSAEERSDWCMLGLSPTDQYCSDLNDVILADEDINPLLKAHFSRNW